MTNHEKAVMIERVLRGIGGGLFQEEYLPDIEVAVLSIKARYRELKRDHDFTASAHLARVEWIEAYLEERDEARAKVDDLKAELQLTQTKLRIARERHSADMAKCYAEIFERTKERDEARREADRLRHNEPIEGDFVCPNEYRAYMAEKERDEALQSRKAYQRKYADQCALYHEAHTDVERLREALRGLLLSRDAAWTGGHDWQEAVDEAVAAFDATTTKGE